MLKQIFALLRLSHWSKASFVLLGVFYSGSTLFLGKALLAALAFCLISSAVYIYNDIEDRDEDRLHPQKCKRPLALGEFPITLALGLLAVLLTGGLALAFYISSTLVALLGLYLLINVAYNHLFKNLAIFDVICIASGFMLRVLAGTKGIGLPISIWLTVTATLVSLFIALCKRRLEKQLGLNNTTRAVLKKYSTKKLDILISLSAISCFASYLLYILYNHFDSFYFLLTIPFAAIGLWRFSFLTTQSTDNDDPVSVFFMDNFSRFTLLCFVFLTFLALLE